MRRLILLLILTLLNAIGFGQFVRPTAEEHRHDPNLYHEDPFIIKYRHRFFAVFSGDYQTFRNAYHEIAQMVVEHPDDARAIVWLGNGQTVEAAVKLMRGNKRDSIHELEISRRNLDRAVALRPWDPNIYMMRAATLYVQGQYWPANQLPVSVWQALREDCQSFIRFLGPSRMARVSVHVRGETYGELGIAEKNLGNFAKSRDAFAKVIQLCPNTEYDKRARKELLGLKG